MKSLLCVMCLLLLSTPRLAQDNRRAMFKMIAPVVTRSLTYSDAYISIIFIPAKSLHFKLTNKTKQPIEIDWNHASFTDTDSTAHRVVHQGVRYIERDSNLPPTIIPPGANVFDVAHPSDYISYDSSSAEGWKMENILPDSDRELIGKVFGLFLPLKINGRLKNYNFKFTLARESLAEATARKKKEDAERDARNRLNSVDLKSRTIKRTDYPNTWPFKAEEGILLASCKGYDNVFFSVNGKIYALTRLAGDTTIDGNPVLTDLSEILAKPLGIMVMEGHDLCR